MRVIVAVGLTLALALSRVPGQARDETAPRQNVALRDFGTKASGSAHPHFPVYNPAGVIDGNHSDESAVRLIGLPSEIVLEFVEEREVNRVRLYPGRTHAPVDYEIEGFVNGGWAPLARVVGPPAPAVAGRKDDDFVEHEFPSMYLSHLRLRITRSTDNRERSRTNGTKELVPPDERTTYLREIEVFETISGRHGLNTGRKTADFLSGDFNLPFYRNQSSAKLHLIVKDQAAVPDSIEFRLRAPDGTTELRRFVSPLRPGRNEVEVDIAGLPSGRYPLTGTVRRDGRDEDIVRLLRIDQGSPALRQPEGADLTGKILYPIDEFHVESMQGLTVKVNPAQSHFVAWAKLTTEKVPGKVHWLNKIGPLAATADGRLALSFQDAAGADFVWRHAITPDPRRPAQWEIRDGPAPEAAAVARPPGASRKWIPQVPLEEATFRFYDPARDGKPPLAEIRVFHTGTVRKDFSGLPITFRGTYAVWEKKPGEVLFLSREAMLEDITLPGGEVFEREKDTSDNFGGQMLSADGKTYFYFASNVVKRFAPFIVPYDNQRHSNRLLSVNYTQDGFNWKRHFIVPVTDRDPWSLQQYGALIYKDPESDVYWGYLASYHCERQQIYLDIMFSRDLLHWTRPGDAPFIANTTEPDSWLFGLTLPSLPSLQVGDRLFHLLGQSTAHAHFYLKDNNTPEFIQQRFDNRGLRQWPYFEAAGGYAGLSRSMQLAYTRRPVGIAVSRPNGHVALSAGEKSGTLVTRAVRSSGPMTLNASTGPHGWIQVDLLSPDGTVLPKYSRRFQGDDLRAPVFGELPSTAFKIQLTLQDARVFSIRL